MAVRARDVAVVRAVVILAAMRVAKAATREEMATVVVAVTEEARVVIEVAAPTVVDEVAVAAGTKEVL